MTGKREIILVRHAVTHFNQDRRITGKMDIALAENAAVDGINDFEGTVYSSPLRRCRQTLQKMSPALLEKAVCDARLTERDMGIFEGEKKDEMRRRYPQYFESGRFAVFMTPPEGEPYEAIYDRIYSFYTERISRTEDNVLVCGHNHALKILKAVLLGQEVTMDYWVHNNFKNGKGYRYYI